MLTQEEQKFVEYWEKNRDKEKSMVSMLIFGGPWGLIFALPILIVVIFHDWYKRMIPISRSQIVLISICVAAIAFFYAYFRQQMRWQNNDDLYNQLKFKDKKEAEAN